MTNSDRLMLGVLCIVGILAMLGDEYIHYQEKTLPCVCQHQEIKK